MLTYDRPQTSLACTIFFDWQGLNNCRLNSCCAVSLPDCIAEICGQFFVAGDGTEIMAERACKIARQSDLSCVIKSCTRTSRVSYPHSNSKWYPGALRPGFKSKSAREFLTEEFLRVEVTSALRRWRPRSLTFQLLHLLTQRDGGFC